MKTYIFTILLFFLGVIATAQISLPPFFTNNMVIQRDQKFPVWGKAQPNTIITVRFATTDFKISCGISNNRMIVETLIIEINDPTKTATKKGISCFLIAGKYWWK